MYRLRNWQGAAVVLACWGLLVPQTTIAADSPVVASVAPQPKAPRATDVALTSSGLLVGAAYTPDGKHLDGAVVVVTQGEKELVRTNTDENGAFAIAQMKSGTYQIGIGDKVAPIRVWTADTAPPKAKQKAILVTGAIVRGQGEYYDDGFGADGNFPGTGGPALGLDVITLFTVAAATTAGVVSIVNLNQLNELQDDVNKLQEQVDQITSP